MTGTRGERHRESNHQGALRPAADGTRHARDVAVVARFKRWFWRRPRAHGDTILDRRVSPLESLYDLVYAVVISQAALPLEQHLSARQTVTCAVVFALIWIAWTNGSLYLELHGREDGRTRTFVFIQIGILALVAVFAPNAAGDSGPA